MREFTDKEKELIEKLISFKQTARLIELQAARLLRKDLQCFALSWTKEPYKNIILYSNKDTQDGKPDWDALNKSYFQVADFLYFIEELEQNGFIKLQILAHDNKNDQENAQGILYDKELYEYDSKHNSFKSKNNNLCNGITKELFPNCINGYSKIHVDISDQLERYADKIIYPLPILEDLYEHDYKSIEQRNFEKQLLLENRNHREQMSIVKRQFREQMRIAERQHNEQMNANKIWQEEQMGKTRCSLRIAFFSIIVSAISPFILDRCSSPTKVDNAQLETIKNAIIESKSVVPDSINVCYSDTLKIRTIMPKKNK